MKTKLAFTLLFVALSASAAGESISATTSPCPADGHPSQCFTHIRFGLDPVFALTAEDRGAIATKLSAENAGSLENLPFYEKLAVLPVADHLCQNLGYTKATRYTASPEHSAHAAQVKFVDGLPSEPLIVSSTAFEWSDGHTTTLLEPLVFSFLRCF